MTWSTRSGIHRSSAVPLALLFSLLIGYASLYPFGQWRDQGLGLFEFLLAPWPRYWSRFDVVANCLGYMPLGFLAALAVMRATLWPHPVVLASLSCALLSLTMETLQGFLPQRVPALSDLILNTVGGVVGAALARIATRWGWMDAWSQWRERWFVPDARAALVLLAIWPMALLYPTAVPFALGQVRQEFAAVTATALASTPLFDSLNLWLSTHFGHDAVPLRTLSPLGAALTVGLSLLLPMLLAYALCPRPADRIVLLPVVCLMALSALALSSALSYGPEHAWVWVTPPVMAGAVIGLLLSFFCLRAPRRLCLVFLLAALVWQLSLINQASETPYYALVLQSWEQGRFIRFQGLTQWLAWIWPYMVLWICVQQILRHPRKNDFT